MLRSSREIFNRWLRRFAADEAGSVTIEFVILVPLALSLCLSAIELGILMTRQMMLDRNLDLVVRDIRLGVYSTVQQDPNQEGNELHDAIRNAVCASAMIPNCQTNLKIEMVVTPIRDPAQFSAFVDSEPSCNDEPSAAMPAVRMNLGAENELMTVRACALYRPIFPNNALSQRISSQGYTYYALTATSAFVIEPGRGRQP